MKRGLGFTTILLLLFSVTLVLTQQFNNHQNNNIHINPCLPSPIDPCQGQCSSLQTCTPGEVGTHECRCIPGYREVNGQCMDVDECAEGVVCHVYAVCENLPGSHRCVCKDGYEGDGRFCRELTDGAFPLIDKDTKMYSDRLDFQLKPPNPIIITQLDAKVYNDPGWLFLSKKGGRIDDNPVVWTDGIPVEMRRGMVGWYNIVYHARDADGVEAVPQTRTVIVEDINECELGLAKCSPNADCVNTNGSYICRCRKGFEGDGMRCVDVDECALGIDECHEHADCINTIGSYLCRCHPGYKGDGFYCVDINECETGEHNCSVNADCINTEGSFMCRCKEGFDGDGYVCVPRNPCLQAGLCDPHADCIRISESTYECRCKPGFQGDGKHCEDINECLNPLLYKCPANSKCVNTIGSYRCDCLPGFEHPSGRPDICIDIDECARELHDCDVHANCINTEGSYYCVCKDGYTGDGKTCTEIPDKLFKLNGANPLFVNQCSSYSEPGIIIDDVVLENVNYSVLIPPALTSHFVEDLGEYDIKYLISEGGKLVEELHRRVIIRPINRCELKEGDPCRHNCHHLAQCVPDYNTLKGFRCECPPCFTAQYSPDGQFISCKDSCPPEITLLGQNPVILRSCKACSWVVDSEPYSEAIHGGYKAYDRFPDASIDDVTEFVVIHREPVNNTAFRIVYNVKDRAGNAAEPKSRLVVEVIEDVNRDIVIMKQIIEDNMSIFQRKVTWLDRVIETVWSGIKMIIGTLLLIVLWFILPKLWNMLSVWYQLAFEDKKVNFNNYVEAYDTWYSMIHPTWAKDKRERVAHQTYHKRYHDN